ncbi:MAG: DNA mismatch repair endonuclease MutL [Candidatus Dasytiphilus stammeri]
MHIHQLSPQVINQIAAGEIVERPASVVKELIENSLDAGANNIEIFIEKGGTRLIRIRDNGCGLHREDFQLALLNHATSKIYTIEDLNNIHSFGFRGEALASLCSVSKLHLTSRINKNDIAYYTYVECPVLLSYNLKIFPTVHPVGTTLDIIDLFYNTPARRKLLRTEQREFSYIDEVVRCVALSRFDISIKLVHNGKLIRYYHRIQDNIKNKKRLAVICGREFYSHKIDVNFTANGLKLYGWITQLSIIHISREIKYFYVNGRIVHNRLMNNAIRKAYQNQQNNIIISNNIKFVLYLEIKYEEVDINVHPTKRDVRFYQNRLVHDFIYQAINNTLIKNQNKQIQLNKTLMVPFESTEPVILQENCSKKNDLFFPKNSLSLDNFLSFKENTHTKTKNNSSHFGRVLTIFKKVIAVVEDNDTLMLISLSMAQKLIFQYYLDSEKKTIKTKQLIFPFLFKIERNCHEIIKLYSNVLKKIGIVLVFSQNYLILKSVPIPLCEPELYKYLIPQLLDFISENSNCSVNKIVNWIINKITEKNNHWDIIQANDLLVHTATLYPQLVHNSPKNFLQRLNLTKIVQELTF